MNLTNSTLLKPSICAQTMLEKRGRLSLPDKLFKNNRIKQSSFKIFNGFKVQQYKKDIVDQAKNTHLFKNNKTPVLMIKPSPLKFKNKSEKIIRVQRSCKLVRESLQSRNLMGHQNFFRITALKSTKSVNNIKKDTMPTQNNPEVFQARNSKTGIRNRIKGLKNSQNYCIQNEEANDQQIQYLKASQTIH